MTPYIVQFKGEDGTLEVLNTRRIIRIISTPGGGSEITYDECGFPKVIRSPEKVTNLNALMRQIACR